MDFGTTKQFEITFIEPLLGTISGNPEIAEKFILSKHPEGVQPDEQAGVENAEEQLKEQTTVFARNSDGKAMLWDYQFKGFLKEACQAITVSAGQHTKEQLKGARLTEYLYKRTIDSLIFVEPRQIILESPNGDEFGFCERPLRGQTMRGERIALARSEEAPAGTKITLAIRVLNKKLWPFVLDWLEYGKFKGSGCWRNSGKGRFLYQQLRSK